MNFEAEIAVFQASFYSCESDKLESTFIAPRSSKTPAGLQTESINVNAVCHAVREITHGLEGDRSDIEKRLWNFKLHAILFWKLLKTKIVSDAKLSQSTLKCRDSDCWLGYFEGISNALPDHIGLGVYLEVVRNLQWEPICAEVLRSVDHEVSQDLLADITAECIVEGSWDLLIGILTCLLNPSPPEGNERFETSQLLSSKTNPQHRTTAKTVCSVGGADYHRLVMLTCDQVLTAKSQIEGRNQRSDLIHAMWTSLDALVFDLCAACEKQESKSGLNESEPCQSSVEFRPLRSWEDDQSYSSEIYNLHLLSSSHREECLRVIERDRIVHRGGSRSHRGTGEVSSECRVHLLEAVGRLVFTLHDLLLEAWKDFSFEASLSNTSGPDCGTSQKDGIAANDLTLAKSFLQVLHRLLHCVSQSSWSIHTDLMQEQCRELTAHLSGICEGVGAMDNETALAGNPSVATETAQVTNGERGHIWLWEAISRVDDALEGYEEDFAQLLSSSDQWEEDAWIECLERNTVALALPGFVKQLIGVVMAMDARETFDEVLLQRVLKVLLASFSSLPLLLQNQLRDHLWSRPAGVTVFARRSAGNFDQGATSAFNRLVTLARGQENTEVLTSLSCLALQSPAQTLQEAVSRAVSNAAVCQAVCQALQAMPSLATFRRQAIDEWPLLCHLIHEAARTLATSASEEANLVQLVTTLLKPYKPLLDPQYPFWMLPVLSAQGVLQVCSLPQLNADISQTSNLSHLTMALRFLHEVLDFDDAWNQNGDCNVPGASTFPIMLCLCELLNSCQVLWDGTAIAPQKIEVKEIVLGLLGRMGQRITMMPNDKADRGTAWLIDRASATLHWTTALTLRALLPDYSQHQKKLVPECVVNMCHLSDTEWSSIPSHDSQQRPIPLCSQLTDLLLCCRASDNLAAILSQNIQAMEESSRRSFRQALSLALVQVLPQCIMGEWQCIMGMLTQLLANGVLTVPCSASYLIQLPMWDISDFRVYLSLSQLLLSVMQLLTGPCCQDWASPQLLHHVTRCYVNTLQSLTSDMLNSDLCKAPGCLFVIGQLFCHACEVTGSLPTEDLKEQVFVLMLEFLSRMQEVTPTGISCKELDFEWTNQRAVLELLTNQKLAGEQRKTLLQKISSSKEGTGL